MSDHDTHHAAAPAQPWPAGWLVALVAGIIAAVLAKWLGDITALTAVLIGVFVFLVFGVLLGMFWDATPASALGENAGGHHGHDDHGHGDHGHDDHGHADHGHDHSDHSHAAAPVAVAAPVVAAPAAAPVAAAVAAPAPVEPAAAPIAAPVAEAAAEAVTDGAGSKPQGLSGPRGGVADNLKEIEGIGPALEKLCNELGIFHFDQIAAWGGAEVQWMDGNLKGFKGRVTRDKWVAQSKIIVAEGVEAFRIRAKTNDY